MMLIVLLLVLVALGVPVSFALGLSGVVFFITHDIKLVTFAQNFAVGIDSFSLLAAPFFILVGNIMNESGITKKIFRFANSIVGCLPGGPRPRKYTCLYTVCRHVRYRYCGCGRPWPDRDQGHDR